MSSYFVSYDLTAPDRDYDELYEAINKYPNTKVLESCFIIQSSSDHVTIRDFLKSHMDSNDRLFVAKLTGTCAWSNVLSSSDTIKKLL